MTKVRLIEDNNHYRIEAKGHATGSVEVCSAISMLIYTLADFLADTAKYSLEEGNAYVEYSGDRMPYDMIKGGFDMLARDYPEFVKIV